MLNIILPKEILTFVDHSRGKMSRALFIIKCIDKIKELNITIDKYNERSKTNVSKYRRDEPE